MLSKADDGWTLDLSEYRVTQCLVDFAFSIVLHAHAIGFAESVLLRIEEPFICEINGERFSLDAEKYREELGPALGLFQRVASVAQISERGDLRLSFVDGAHLIVAPDPKYEAWNLSGPFGQLVALPGGDVAVIPPNTPETQASRP
jgi:Family of unknown function (DUF6188)